jgi:hypothetical protein
MPATNVMDDTKRSGYLSKKALENYEAKKAFENYEANRYRFFLRTHLPTNELSRRLPRSHYAWGVMKHDLDVLLGECPQSGLLCCVGFCRDRRDLE